MMDARVCGSRFARASLPGVGLAGRAVSGLFLGFSGLGWRLHLAGMTPRTEVRGPQPPKTMSSSSSFAGREYDAVVVGSGPNGLSAAITIAEAGHSVVLIEGKETLGGGTRSAELTLPGFLHDVCSCVYPMAVWSPFFRSLPLKERGLEWVEPAAPLAHPLDDGSAIILDRSVEATAENLCEDRERYVRLLSALLSAWPKLESSVQRPFGFPAHPLAAMRFGWTV